MLVPVPELVDDVVARGRVAVALACAAHADDEERLRAGLGALLAFLEDHRELVWACLARPPKDGALVDRRALVDAALAAALPAPDPRTVADGWRMVHERLWRFEQPRLPELLGPLLALIALRSGGVRAVPAALQAAAIAA